MYLKRLASAFLMSAVVANPVYGDIRTSNHAYSVTADDASAIPWPCPQTYGFYTFYSFSGYFFLFDVGTYDGWISGVTGPYGTYTFGLAIGDGPIGQIKAFLLNPSLTATCRATVLTYSDGSHAWDVWAEGGTATGTLRIVHERQQQTKPVPPSFTGGGGGGSPPSGGGTYQEYCIFVNYYDANWNYLYSEPISCWYEQT